MKPARRGIRPWLWVAALAPAIAGIALSVRLALVGANPTLYARMSLDFAVLALGLGLSAIAVGVLGVIAGFSRQQEKQMAASAEERRRFLRRLDHEMKNPLTAIRAGLANLAEGPGVGTASPAEAKGDEARQETLASIEAQTLRLSRLAADLRKLAELETRLLEHAPVDLTRLLNEAYHLAQEQPAAAARHLSLALPRAPWPLPRVTGDPDLLFLAVHNLLENALKFTRPGDTIELRAFEDGSSVVIEVADTGPGIPAGEQPQVWEELYRGEASRGTPGSGLGLALVRAIAERHHGQASLRSRPGQGTVFSLRLPAG